MVRPKKTNQTNKKQKKLAYWWNLRAPDAKTSKDGALATASVSELFQSPPPPPPPSLPGWFVAKMRVSAIVSYVLNSSKLFLSVLVCLSLLVFTLSLWSQQDNRILCTPGVLFITSHRSINKKPITMKSKSVRWFLVFYD